MSHSNERMMAIAIRKSLLKETNISNYSSGKQGNVTWASMSCRRVVYMNDGDEFQIQLFNPENVTVGCLIYINGKLMSHRKIVLRPGERIWLDRHIDSPDKLKFSTYEVGKSKAAQEAIKDNGLIRVEFYKEQDLSYISPTVTWEPHIYQHTYTAGDGSFVCGHSTANYSAALGDCCIDNLADIQTRFTSAVADAHDIQCKANKIETGRVEKGSRSNQTFNHVSQDFEMFAFKTEEVQILPMSQKPVRANDLRKKFCPYCGKKVKDGFKFCPNCGAQL